MRRRTFLRLSAAAAGAGILRQAGAGILRRAGAPRARYKAQVLIVGADLPALAALVSLRRLNPAIAVTVIDPDEVYVTCPMSNAALVGLRGMESLNVTRRGLERAGIDYVLDRVAAVDVQGRRARLAGGTQLSYDRLVVAPGIRFLWGTPEGYDESAALAMPHAWQAGAQTRILAEQLREMRDGGVVAISVPAGPMRCPPGPFERASLIAGYLKEHKPRSKVLIFDSNNRFPKQDAFTEAWHSLYPGMIEWIPVVEDGAVTRVAPAKKVLYTSHGTHRVDVANIIPPQAPGLLAAQMGLASDHGWCPIQPATFESGLIAGVHVIGDACIADPMPKAASAASSQARQCALAIAAVLDGREPPAPLFESVCYSMLTPHEALSIHGRFQLVDGVIRSIAKGANPGAVSPEQEARNAQEWYRTLVADSFGA